ncbi:MAG: phosphoglucomutase/phosphomannomutase family protein [Chloroflexota bacterium]
MTSPIKFGTDGWRALIAEDYTFDNVRICAQATMDWLKSTERAAGGLVIGYDTRFGSERFAQAVAEVAAGNGVKVLLTREATPTPVVSYNVMNRQAGGGVIITSSHNPASYNGFKIKTHVGASAEPEVIDDVEARIDGISLESVKRTSFKDALSRGQVEVIDAKVSYLEQVHRLVDLGPIREAGLTVAIDAMFGAGSGYFQSLLLGGSTRLLELRQEYNPGFPGIAPEPILPHINLLLETIRSQGADVGLATDGDADRIGLADEHGTFINQHQVYALLFLYLLEQRGLRGPAVRSVTSTEMADALGRQFDVPVYETAVGFKYVGPRMVETNAIIGGEESGGFGFAGHIPERDAIVAGVYLLDLMVKLQRPMSGVLDYLRDKVGPRFYHRWDVDFPADQREIIAHRVATATPAEVDGSPVASLNTIDGYKWSLEDGSWLLIRFSGTEPLLRIYTETNAQDRVERILSAGKQIAGV